MKDDPKIITQEFFTPVYAFSIGFFAFNAAITSEYVLRIKALLGFSNKYVSFKIAL